MNGNGNQRWFKWLQQPFPFCRFVFPLLLFTHCLCVNPKNDRNCQNFNVKWFGACVCVCICIFSVITQDYHLNFTMCICVSVCVHVKMLFISYAIVNGYVWHNIEDVYVMYVFCALVLPAVMDHSNLVQITGDCTYAFLFCTNSSVYVVVVCVCVYVYWIILSIIHIEHNIYVLYSHPPPIFPLPLPLSNLST